MKSGQLVRGAWTIGLVVALLVALRWLTADAPGTEETATALRVMDRGVIDPPPPELPTPAAPTPLVSGAVNPASGIAAETESPNGASGADEAAAELRVFVVDPHGLAIEGAEVVSNRGEPRRQLTDEAGLARIAARSGDTVGIAARHPDFRLAAGRTTLSDQDGGVTEIQLQLTEGLTACIEVQARDGRPIEGASVRFREIAAGEVEGTRMFDEEALQRWIDSDHIRGTFREVRETDLRGRCCVMGARSGNLSLSVEAEGFVPAIDRNVTVDADGGDLGVIVLAPAVQLIGIVEDSAGVVPGAVVEARFVMKTRPDPAAVRDSYEEVYRRTTTSDDGTFVLEGAPKLPTLVACAVSHAERGHFHGDLTFTAQPTHVMLVPDIDVVLVLTDAQTRQPVAGVAELELHVPREPLLIAKGTIRGFHVPIVRTATIVEGRVELTQLPHYLEKLRVLVADYDAVSLPKQAIVGDTDQVLELELTRPTQLLVRVHAAGSGAPLEDARLHVSQVREGANGSKLNSGFLIQGARFDSVAGGYALVESELGVADNLEVNLYVDAKGYRPSEPVPIAVNGQRVSAATIDVYLEPE